MESTFNWDEVEVGKEIAPLEYVLSEELVEGILALCHWRRMGTVAEGVETAEQRRRLCHLGCNYAQGYLFAPPAEVEKIEESLKKETLM